MIVVDEEALRERLALILSRYPIGYEYDGNATDGPEVFGIADAVLAVLREAGLL